MDRKQVVLAIGVGLAFMGMCEPTIKDGSVLGYWRFNGEAAADRLTDASGYGNPMGALSSGASTAATGGLTGGCRRRGRPRPVDRRGHPAQGEEAGGRVENACFFRVLVNAAPKEALP